MQTWSKQKKTVLLFCLIASLCYVLGITYIVKHIKQEEVSMQDTTKRQVALVTKSTQSAFWKSVFAGASAAGTEYNLSLTMEGPENEEDYQTQNELLQKAADGGAEVIVLSAVDYNGNAQLVNELIDQGIDFIVIDSDVNSEGVRCRIGTDNYAAGQMAGEGALDIKEEQLHIGLVNFDVKSENGQAREEGCRQVLSEDSRVQEIHTVNVVSTTEDAKVGTIELIESYPTVNVIVTFNEWTSLGVGAAIQELGLKDEIHVVAFDSNVISVGMLETGEVDALVVQNPYAMGYLGVEHAYNLLKGIPIKEVDLDTATTLVTRDNMYQEAYQKVLFAFD